MDLDSLIAAAASRSTNSTPRNCSSHARKEANRRKLDDVLIVDVDAHHYENEHMSRNPPIHGERRVPPTLDVGPAAARTLTGLMPRRGRLSGYGRPRHPLSAARLGKDRRRPAVATCSSASAGWTPWASTIPACSRPACCRIGIASAEGNGGSNCAGPTTAGSPKRCCRSPRAASSRCSMPAVLRCRTPACGPCRKIRRPQGRDRLHGDDRARPAGARQLPT